MKISVVTVCFNAVNTIAAALQSVAAQTHPDVEHIVIDGGSNDGTLERIAEHGKHLAYFVSEPDRGIYDAMNKGLAKANGDIICFLNADDHYASPHILSHVARHMAEGALDAVIGDVAFFRPGQPERIVRRFRSGRFRPGRFAWGWMPAHPGLFLRREVVERVGKFKIDYKIAGDFEFIVRAFHGHSLRYRHLPEIMVNMQTGGTSTAGLRSTILLNKEVLRACRENGIKTNWMKILSKYPQKLTELMRT